MTYNNIATAARRRKETLARARTLAVICYVTYRFILWAVPGTRPIEAVQSSTLLWHCFRAVFNLVLWLIGAAFWTIVNLARIIP
jgi:hypothetical protein